MYRGQKPAFHHLVAPARQYRREQSDLSEHMVNFEGRGVLRSNSAMTPFLNKMFSRDLRGS